MNSLAEMHAEKNRRERYAASIIGNMRDRMTYFALLSPDEQAKRGDDLAREAVTAVLVLVTSWQSEKAS